VKKFLCLVSASGLFAIAAHAQNYPARAVRIIVPFVPGGATDILGRMAGQKLNERFGLPFVVENRAGGGGNIGAEFVAKSDPDGYTLMIGGVPHAIGMSLYSRLPYELSRDLAAITNLAVFPSMIIVHPSLPVKTMKELIAFAKSRPGQLNYGSTPGSPNHLAIELLNVQAAVKMIFIPYKGAGQATAELVAGHVQVSSLGFPSSLAMVQAGKLRALAVTSAKRSAMLPDLPTVAESGVPGYDVNSWHVCASQHARCHPATPLQRTRHTVQKPRYQQAAVESRRRGEHHVSRGIRALCARRNPQVGAGSKGVGGEGGVNSTSFCHSVQSDRSTRHTFFADLR
jgi:tripartite-type tricarboxylate transporter receptor subunit TctC